MKQSSKQSKREIKIGEEEKNKNKEDVIKDYCKNYFEMIYKNIREEKFLEEEKDMNMIEEFVEIIEEIKENNKGKKEEEKIIKIIGYMIYRMRESEYKWANLRIYFTTERMKKIMKKMMHINVKYMSEYIEKNVREKENQEMIEMMNRINQIMMKKENEMTKEEIDEMFKIEEFGGIKIGSKGIEKLEENKKKEEKMDMMNLNKLDKEVMKGLLRIDVTQNINEEGRNEIYGEIVEEIRRQFNYEEMGITKYFEYLEKRLEEIFGEIEKVKSNKKISMKEEKIIKEFNTEIENILTFIMETFPKIEPTCIGNVAKVLCQITELHHLLSEVNYHETCETLVTLIYSITTIIGDNIGNVIVETNMQAYCAAHLFQTLLNEEFSLKEFMKNIEKEEGMEEMPCLYPMAVALTFSREVFQKINTNKKYIVDESSYKNVSSKTLKLKMYEVEFDALMLQSNEVLTSIILTPQGKFLDIIFSLLVMSYLSVGYIEKMVEIEKAKKNTKKVQRIDISELGKKEEEGSNGNTGGMNKGIKSPRMISPRGIIGGSVRKGISTPRRALGGSIGTPRQTLGGSIGTPRQIIGSKGGKPMIGTGRKALNEGKEKEMEEEEKNEIDYELTRSLPLYLSIYIFGESSNETLRKYVGKYFNSTHLDVIIFLTHVESYNVKISSKSNEMGPIVKDKESIMNMRSLCSSLVNYKWLSEQLMGYIIRKQMKEYSMKIPIELSVFLSRIWIHRITNREEGGKDDMQGVTMWNMMIMNLKKIKEEKVEILDQEYVIMMILIYNSFSKENKKKYIKEMYGIMNEMDIEKNEYNKIILSRVLIMLKYMIEQYEEKGNEIMEEVEKKLLKREIYVSEKKEVEVPYFMERQRAEMEKKKMNEYYSIGKEKESEVMISKMRKGIVEKKERMMEGIVEEEEYEYGIEKLLKILKKEKDETDEEKRMMDEYLYQSIIEILTIMTPNKKTMKEMKESNCFSKEGINDLIVMKVIWFNMYSYNINDMEKGIEENSKEIFKDMMKVIETISKMKEKKSGVHYESIVKSIIDTIECHCWEQKRVEKHIEMMEAQEEMEDEVEVDEEMLRRKKVTINVNKNEKSEKRESVGIGKKEKRESVNANEEKRKILKKEIDAIEEVIGREDEEEEEKEKVKEEVPKQKRIIDNLPVLPIETFSKACIDQCVRKPQIIFEIIGRYIDEYIGKMEKEWEKYIEEEGIEKGKGKNIVKMTHQTSGIVNEMNGEELYYRHEQEEIVKNIGKKKYIELKEMIHPMNYIIESAHYHPNVYSSEGKIGSIQSIIMSMMKLIKEICERNNINGNYSENKVMKELFRMGMSSVGQFIYEEIDGIGNRMCGETIYEIMKRQSIIANIDESIEEMNKDMREGKMHIEMIPTLKKKYEEMKEIVEEVMEQRKYGKIGYEMYHYEKKGYYREPNVIEYIKNGNEIKEKEINEDIMEYLTILCKNSSVVKEEMESIIDTKGKEEFSKWSIQKLIGYEDYEGVFRVSESSNMNKYFEFVDQISKVNKLTGMRSNAGVVESLSKGMNEVYTKYPQYIGKYFKTISEYALEQGEFSSVLNNLNQFLEKVNSKKEMYNGQEMEGMNELLTELQHIVLTVPRREKENKPMQQVKQKDEKKEENEGEEEEKKVCCSKKIYEDEFKQPMYYCYLCEVECCNSCIETCHEGHDTIYIGKEKSICECECKEEEEKKKEKKKGNAEEGIKDKRQQAIIRAFNRDYKTPENIKKIIEIIEKSKEEKNKEEENMEQMLKMKSIIQNEGINRGFIEREIVKKEVSEMESSSNMRIITLVKEGIIVQNMINCDRDNFYIIKRGNEMYVNSIETIKKGEIDEREENKVEVSFEIINIVTNKYKNQKKGGEKEVIINGYRNGELVVIDSKGNKEQIEINLGSNDKEIYIQRIEYISEEYFYITTPTFIKIYQIGKSKSGETTVKSIEEITVDKGEIISGVIVREGSKYRVYISTREEEIKEETFEIGKGVFGGKRIVKREMNEGRYERQEYEIKVIEGVNMIVMNNVYGEGYIKHKEKLVEMRFNNRPTRFITTKNNNIISYDQEKRVMNCNRIMATGMNYIKMYENEEIGGICYEEETNVIFVGICGGGIQMLEETNEIERIQRLKPLRLENQKYLEQYENISKESYEIVSQKEKIIVAEGRIVLNKKEIKSKDMAIRGIKIQFGEKAPKQINFRKRSYPIGEGKRWYEIEMKKKESVESERLEISYIGKEGEEIEIEEMEIYGEKRYEFQVDERKAGAKEKEIAKEKQEKESNKREESIEIGIEIIGVIYNITRSSRDRDKYKEEIIKKIQEMNKKYPRMNKVCEDSMKMMSQDSQSERKIIQRYKEMNERMNQVTSDEEWDQMLIYINDQQQKRPETMIEYMERNPRFVTKMCDTAIEKYSKMKASIVSIISDIIMKNIEISSNVTKQHLEIMRKILNMGEGNNEVGVIRMCEKMKDRYPRIKEMEYKVRSLIQENKIVGVEKELEIKTMEIQFEYVDNLKQELDVHRKHEEEEKLQTIKETKEITIEKVIDEREEREIEEKQYNIIKGLLEMMNDNYSNQKDYSKGGYLGMVIYWMITKENYIMKEEQIEYIMEKLMEITSENKEEKYVKISIMKELMSSLDIEYYQNYSRKELNNIEYDMKEGIMPKPSIRLSRQFAQTIMKNSKYEKKIYEIFQKEYKEIKEKKKGEENKKEKKIGEYLKHMKPIRDEIGEEVDKNRKNIENIMTIVYYLFNYKRDMEIEDAEWKEKWNEIIQEIINKEEYHNLSYSGKKMIYQFGGGAYNYHLKSDNELYKEYIPKMIEMMNRIIRKEKINMEEYEKIMKKVIKTSYKRPNLFQRYIREDNEIVILLIEIISDKREEIIYRKSIELLRSCFINNVDKSIRKKPMKYGINQYQTIIEEREKVIEDIKKNEKEQKYIIESIMKEKRIIANIVKASMKMGTKEIIKEMKRLMKSIGNICTKSQQEKMIEILWESYSSNGENEEILKVIEIVSFIKSQKEMKIDSSIEQYLN